MFLQLLPWQELNELHLSILSTLFSTFCFDLQEKRYAGTKTVRGTEIYIQVSVGDLSVHLVLFTASVFCLYLGNSEASQKTTQIIKEFIIF